MTDGATLAQRTLDAAALGARLEIRFQKEEDD